MDLKVDFDLVSECDEEEMTRYKSLLDGLNIENKWKKIHFGSQELYELEREVVTISSDQLVQVVRAARCIIEQLVGNDDIITVIFYNGYYE